MASSVSAESASDCTGPELSLVVLHDAEKKRILLEVPNSLGWRYHYGAKGDCEQALEDSGLKTIGGLLCAGLMDFTFADHAPMRIRVFKATPVDAQKVGRYYNELQVPYDRMWADDHIWLPDLLAGRTTYFEAEFFFGHGPPASAPLLRHTFKRKEN